MMYLFLMTAAGSMLFLLYFVWEKICGEHVNARMKYAVLVVVILVHLIPLKALQNVYSYFLNLLPRPQTVPGSDIQVNVAEVSTATKTYFTPDYRWGMLVASIWVSFSALLFLTYCIIHLHNKFRLRKLADACRCELGVKIVERLRKENHLKRRIDVLQVEGEDSPRVIGVFRPMIILNTKLEEDELEWALRHELTHITQGDVMFKLVLQLVCCLYWFNPIVHCFNKYFTKICEFSCDAGVTIGRTKEELGAYSKVLTKIATDKKGGVVGSSMADNKKIIPERINEVMNIRKMKRWEKIIAVSVFVVFMLADSLVAFAYPSVYHVEDTTEDVEFVTTTAAGDSLWIHDDVDIEFEVLYDVEFIDENGTITPVNEAEPAVLCIGHNWVQGYMQTHALDGKGGCTVKLYNSKRCIYCDTIVVEGLYKTIIYATCPH